MTNLVLQMSIASDIRGMRIESYFFGFYYLNSGESCTRLFRLSCIILGTGDVPLPTYNYSK